MRDLDSAVGRLDNIFMSLYVLIAGLIIAVVLDAQFANVLTGAGTVILGLSWLIGGSLQEVLSSILFLFIKHPYDVGDRVVITKDSYTVKEIRLLSTIFLDSNNCLVQAPHLILTTQVCTNNHMMDIPQTTLLHADDSQYQAESTDVGVIRVRGCIFYYFRAD